LDGAAYGPETGHRFAPHVGYVAQSVSFPPGTVAENIARFTDAKPERIVQAARRAGAHELILSLPDGYETVLGGPDEPLSAGARQRIALARALFGGTKLLVLDEPYSNLDDAGVTSLMDAVLKFRAAGGTTVMVAHRPSVIARADRVARLDGGRLVEEKVARPAPPRRLRAGGLS
jgi:ATP-binding cassette subfamily C exporter for protease/lipase